MTFSAGDILTADDLNNMPRVLGRAKRTTASTTTTTVVGVLRLDDIPIKSGHLIKIQSSPLHLKTDVANDTIYASYRYTTDGSAPTTASTLLALSQLRVTASASDQATTLTAWYTPAADETLSVLLCVTRAAGTGNVNIDAGATFPIEFTVHDDGVDPGDTGVDI